MKGLCKCGCGQKTSIITKTSKGKGDVKGEPQQFIQGHHSRVIHWNWKGGKITSNGYIMVLSPKHPFCDKHGYVREHRLVIEKSIGRYLKPKEVVHHKNEIKDDNRIENLILTNKEEHMKLYHPNAGIKGRFKVGHK